jgi:hypothetical protein
MGERAWRRIARDNAWSDVAERTLAVYETAATPAATPPRSIPVPSHR